MDVLYGTNFHRGLMLARQLNPKWIVLIAYSAPTAHWIAAQQHEFFMCPPGEETLFLTRRELGGHEDDGTRIDAVLIDDPTRVEDHSWSGRLQEIYDLALDATYRSHGLLAHLETPVSDTAIADIAHAITCTADQ